MYNKSLIELLKIKRLYILYLAIFLITLLFLVNLIEEEISSQRKAKALSTLAISEIKKLSFDGELLYAQRQLENIINTIGTFDQVDTKVIVKNTGQILANIQSENIRRPFVEELAEVQALPHGTVLIHVKIGLIERIMLAVYKSVIGAFIILCAFILILRKIEKSEESFMIPIDQAITIISQININSDEVSMNLQIKKIENRSLITMYESIIALIQDVKQMKLSQELANIAQQVAHDIRSPLSALSMVTATLKDIPEEKRIIIRNATQRINDIANDLLSKGKPNASHDISKETSQILMTEPAQKLTVQFLPVLVDLLVSEKRMQYMMRSDLEISTELNEGFGAFALVDDRELKRVMSNLINNSVESFANLSEQKNKIIIEVRKLNSKQVAISIKDNGQGIPEEVLSKLGHEQLSHGKENLKDSGSGLGLYHAKKVIERLQGEFKIESTLNEGTTVSLILPLSETPSWFATEINLTGKKMLISLDDDISIHQIWGGRLQSLGLTDKIQHVRFQSYELFTDYINQNIDKLSQMQMLIDYELLNQLKTGLDVIEDLVLEKYAILVTSRYEEDKIQERAKKINLKILPKALSGFVPFVGSAQNQTQYYDWILLDDDDLVHMTWKFKAKELNKSFIGFKNLEDLNKHKNHLDKTSPVYVDSNLSDGVKGEDVALGLHTEGFINLYIATGYEADRFSHLAFLKGVLGKDPPSES
ncbi:MAG: sensor histidine kinase [Pseudobdellovibrio sp.]